MNEFKLKSFEEFASELKKYDGGKCYISGCNKPAYYEGGDARCWCPMCEEHAEIRERYLSYLLHIRRRIIIRTMWDKEDTSLEALLHEVTQKMIDEKGVKEREDEI